MDRHESHEAAHSLVTLDKLTLDQLDERAQTFIRRGMKVNRELAEEIARREELAKLTDSRYLQKLRQVSAGDPDFLRWQERVR